MVQQAAMREPNSQDLESLTIRTRSNRTASNDARSRRGTLEGLRLLLVANEDLSKRFDWNITTDEDLSKAFDCLSSPARSSRNVSKASRRNSPSRNLSPSPSPSERRGEPELYPRDLSPALSFRKERVPSLSEAEEVLPTIHYQLSTIHYSPFPVPCF
jgi:hypothetical protein